MAEKIQLTHAGRPLSFETGAIARQADAAILAQYGETVVLAAAVVAKQEAPEKDFFPLLVDYRERTYAAGRMPGGFFKREGKQRDHEILASRLVDRTLRPLFPEALRREVQVDLLVLSYDGANDPSVLALNAAAAAVHLTKAPFEGPVGAIRVGRVEGRLTANPTREQMAASDLDMVIAANEERVVMIEGSADQISEADMAEAMAFAVREIRPLLQAQQDLRKKVGAEKLPAPDTAIPPDLTQAVREAGAARIKAALSNPDKLAREAAVDAAKAAVTAEVLPSFPGQEQAVAAVLAELEWEAVRDMVVDGGVRADGRGPADLRPIACRVGVLPRTHGSALFQRGQTQALVTLTLGTEEDAQKIESLDGIDFKRFLLHYNFPAYSVGEIKPNRGPGRREIGHGHLAERAFRHLLPRQEEFTYVIRAVSEILESNGSSSMATVCGTSLALMDAGVPLKSHVAGISIGLIQRDDARVLITDIQGLEDGMGDMDFKVAGTAQGITAIQLDVKTHGVPAGVLAEALEQAREARLKILETMNAALPAPRPQLSPYAPRVEVVMVPPEKIGGIIGSGGKTIRRLIAESGCSKIEVLDDTGRILVVGANEETLRKGVEMIKSMTEEAEVGRVYVGKVIKLTDFGAFVEILPGTDGLIHVSQISHERVRHPADVLKEGDQVRVKVIEVDPGSGRIRLTLRDVPPDGEGHGGEAAGIVSREAPRAEPLPPPSPEPDDEFADDGPQPEAGAHERSHDPALTPQRGGSGYGRGSYGGFHGRGSPRPSGGYGGGGRGGGDRGGGRDRGGRGGGGSYGHR
jgi:polyribonucleotide nucleotidyltransferase